MNDPDHDFEILFWAASYLVAQAQNEAMPHCIANTAVRAFRNSEAFCGYVPPEEWDDEDVPF